MRMTRWMTVVILALVVSVRLMHAAPAAPTDADVKARVDALLAKMTLDDKIGQLNQAGALAFGPNAPKVEDVVRKGGAGSVLWLNDTKAVQRAAEDRRRGEPVEDPAALRSRRHPRLPDDLPGAAGDGLVVGPGGRGARADRRRPRSPCSRAPVDLRSDGGHRPRRALGTHRRRRWRGSVPRLGDGRGTGARLSGAVAERSRRSCGRVREALRRLRRRRWRP